MARLRVGFRKCKTSRLECEESCHPPDFTAPQITRFIDLARHPTQLYESLFHLTAAGVFLWLASRNLFAGQRIKLYLIAYASYRFLSEWLRPEAQIFGVFTGYQIGSLVIITLFSWLWIRDQNACNRDVVKTRASGLGKT